MNDFPWEEIIKAAMFVVFFVIMTRHYERKGHRQGYWKGYREGLQWMGPDKEIVGKVEAATLEELLNLAKTKSPGAQF